MIFIEPSFLISFYNEKSNKHEKSKELFFKLNNDDFIISYMVIAEVLTVLRKINVSDEIVEKAYNHMVKMIVVDDTGYYHETFKYSLKNKIGFFDNLYYILMKDLKIKNIVSFDQDFDIFNDIKRIY